MIMILAFSLLFPKTSAQLVVISMKLLTSTYQSMKYFATKDIEPESI